MCRFYQETAADDATYYGYGRLHAQFNEFGGTIPVPRLRLQITNPAFAHTTEWTSPTDFTHSQGWHEMKVEVSGTTANCYFDGGLLGNADWTSAAPERSSGRFGFGQYIDGAGTRSLYIDNFKAWTTGTSEPADQPVPTATPTPFKSEAQDWMQYE